MKRNRKRVAKKYTFESAFSVVALIGLLGVTFFMSWYAKEATEGKIREVFDHEADEIIIRTEDRLAAYTDLLYAGRGLFTASDYVNRSEWSLFIKSQNVGEKFKGIQAIEYVSRVPDSAKEEFEEAVKSDTSLNAAGYPNFRIRPQGDTESYIVNYIEPFTGNESAFGFDLFSSLERKKAIEKARDENRAITTAPIKLVQETSEQSGFIMLLPIYEGKAEPLTLEERRNRIEGLILAVFRADDLMESILSSINPAKQFGIHIHDITDEKEQSRTSVNEETNLPLYEFHGNEYPGHKEGHSHENPKYHKEETINFGGRTWLIEIETSHDYRGSAINHWFPWIILILGIAISILVSLMIHTTSQTKNRALKLAEQMTSDMNKFKLAVESAYDHIFITNAKGEILYANEASERITGYKAEELIGKNPRVWSSFQEPKKYKELWNQILHKKKTYVGEIKNRKKNGKIYEASTHISPVLDKSGKVQFFVAIEQDISERKAIERAKSEFVSLASHELLTPISSINWYTELLNDGTGGKLSLKQEDYVCEIEEANQKMTKIINRFLNISRLEMGVLKIEPEPVEVKRSIENALKEFKGRIKRKKIKIKKEIPKNEIKIISDNNLFQVILQNLIGNAIKYNKVGGNLEIKVKKLKTRIQIEIADEGIGIPPKNKDKIFQKFYRADNAKNFEANGSGIGLYTVKSVIEKMKGTISFSSNKKEGTRFIVSLPIKGLKKNSGTKKLIPIDS